MCCTDKINSRPQSAERAWEGGTRTTRMRTVYIPLMRAESHDRGTDSAAPRRSFVEAGIQAGLDIDSPNYGVTNGKLKNDPQMLQIVQPLLVGALS